MRVNCLNKKKILIAGGLGFIGSNLAQKCTQLGAQVTIYDNLEPNSGGCLYNINGIRDSLEIAYSDITNFDDISRFVVNKDIIINCSASTSHSHSMREPWLNLDINGRGVINILEAIRRFNCNAKFIHIGTTTQLGKLQSKIASENHPEFPTDIYSANKSVSEKYVLIYGKAYQIPVSVVRLPNVFGPRAAIHSSEFTFNNYFIGLALKNKEITVYGDGNQLRNVLYVEDAVNAIIMAALSDKTNNEVMFAVGDKHYSVAEIAQATVKCINAGTVKFVKWPEKIKMIDIGDAVISNKKIKSILSWVPEMSLKEGLVITRDYYLSCLDQYLR